jgi:iron complex transport system substrate-binding protein
MAMFCSCDALDHVRMSSIKENDWSFDEPREAMEKGDIIYAGKYSAPDYETLFDEECNLAIESTMIDHTPEVKEMIEKLDVPVMIDRSSYEEDPMGRAEWIKLYGVLTDHQEEANAFFDEQMAKLADLDDFENTEKTVAFFYQTADGKMVVRKSTDYVPKMIEIAGARYAFSDLDDDTDRTSIDMSVETFYETARGADYIIYNGSIDGSVKTMADLLEKDPIMKELKAVKAGKCWVTGDSMYQRTDIVADMILDFHKAFTEDDPSDLKYLQKLQ